MLVQTWLQTQLTFLHSDLFIAINVSIDAIFSLEGVLPESMFQSNSCRFVRQQSGFHPLLEQKCTSACLCYNHSSFPSISWIFPSK